MVPNVENENKESGRRSFCVLVDPGHCVVSIITISKELLLDAKASDSTRLVVGNLIAQDARRDFEDTLEKYVS